MLWDTGGKQLIQTCGLGKSPEKMLSKLCNSKSQEAKCLREDLPSFQCFSGRQTWKKLHRRTKMKVLLPSATHLAPKANSAPTSFPKAQPPCSVLCAILQLQALPNLLVPNL